MASRLGVRLLGEFSIDGVDVRRIRSRKARTLLKRLAFERGSAVSHDALLEAVWGDMQPADPSAALSVLASRIRAVIGADRVRHPDAGYVLQADWYDVAEVEELIREAHRRRDAGNAGGARTRALAALTLVRGQLLSDEGDAEWLLAARATAARLANDARSIAAEGALLAGEYGDAAQHARIALDHDAFDEAALRTLMKAYVMSRRPALALAVYAETARHIAEELGVDPDPETRALHLSILTEEPRPVRPTEPPRAVPVGRQDQWRLLEEAMARSRSAAEVVVVSGEAGIGKTYLAQAWIRDLRAQNVAVLLGRAEGGHALALQPIADAIAANTMIGAAVPDVPPGDRALLEQGLGISFDGGPPTPAATPVPQPALPGPAATGAAVQARLFAALGVLLATMCPPTGLVLVIDDAERADPVTTAWLGHVLRRASEHRLLVLALHRDEEQTLIPASTTIRLDPFDLDQTAALVGAERAGEMLDRTGGNPLLLVELAAQEGEDIPVTVRESVADRLTRAGEAAHTLRAAAVLGAAVDVDLLAGVLSVPHLSVIEHLEECVRRAFLVEQDGTMAFRHEIVRAAVAAEATAIRQRWLHRAAARVLVSRPQYSPLELARHAELGADTELAVRGLSEAAALARSRFDLAGAEVLASDAITLADSAQLRLQRGRIRMDRADFAGADEDARVAAELGAGAPALSLRAWAARNSHDMDAAITYGSAGAATATDAITKASCLLAIAFAHRGRGELRDADNFLTDALSQPTAPASLGLPTWLGVLRVHQGRPAEALTLLEPWLGQPEDVYSSFWTEHLLQMTAHAYGMIGRAAEALSAIDRLQTELSRRGSEIRYGGLPNVYRGWILRNLGVADATDQTMRALEMARMAEARAQAYLDLADHALRLSRAADAARALLRVDDELAEPTLGNRWRCEQRYGLIEARLHLLEGSSADALAAAERTLAVASRRGDERHSVIARLLVARAQGRRDRRDVDRALVESDLARLADVAALEAWWLAADVFDDTGLELARVVADRSAERLLEHAGDHAESLKAAVAARLS